MALVSTSVAGEWALSISYVTRGGRFQTKDWPMNAHQAS